jgi:hypothetical protein
VDGLPSEKLRLDLETHLAQCAGCEKQADSLKRSLELLHKAPVESVDENFNWKVRLAVHKERSAMQQRAASQGGVLRAWNVRYGVSAVAGVVAVVAAGWLAVQWGGPGLFDSRVEMPAGAPLAVNRLDPTPNTTRPGNAAATSTTAMEGARRGNPSSDGLGGPGLLVTFGNSPETGSSTRIGAIDASSSVDSLVESELSALTAQERAAYLRALIGQLQDKLNLYEANPR